MDRKYMVSVKACASSANMGPGFDRAAIALDIWNYYRVLGFRPEFELRDLKSNQKYSGGESLLVKSILHTLQVCGKPSSQGLAVEYEENILPGGGWGSSAAQIVAGIILADRCYGLGLASGIMLDIAQALERHPDNVAAALGGGMVVCYRKKGKFYYQKMAVSPHLEVLLFVPHSKIVTEQARDLIPDKVPIGDAADNIANFCLLANALRKGDICQASLFIKDRLHQPYRAKIYPFSMDLVKRLNTDYQIPAAISGSGPSVIAFISKHSGVEKNMRFEGFDLVKTNISFDGSMTY